MTLLEIDSCDPKPSARDAQPRPRLRRTWAVLATCLTLAWPAGAIAGGGATETAQTAAARTMEQKAAAATRASGRSTSGSSSSRSTSGVRASNTRGTTGVAAATSAKSKAAGFGRVTRFVRGGVPAHELLDSTDEERRGWSPEALHQAVQKYGWQRVAFRKSFLDKHTNTYSHELPEGEIGDQGSSGSCWLYSTCETFETNKTGANAGSISRAYLNAQDFRRQAWDLIDHAARNPSGGFASAGGISEGGWFGRALELVDHFGAVPTSAMPNTYNGTHTQPVIDMLQHTVTKAEAELKNVPLHSDAAREIVTRYQGVVDHILERSFGKMPSSFVVKGKTFTPKSYAAHLGMKQGEYVVLTSEADSRPGWSGFTYKHSEIDSYNTSMDVIKKSVMASIDRGEKVYVSAPVGASGSMFMVPKEGPQGAPFPPNAHGIMSIRAFDYASVGGHDVVQVNRATIQEAALHPANHAMAVVGYDVEKDANGKPVLGPDGQVKVIKWKIQNSWGKDAGSRGYMHMYDDFFSHLVTSVAVRTGALPGDMGASVAKERANYQQAKLATHVPDTN